MRNADTILGIIRDRGRRGLPLEDIYRQLFNPDLYLIAYARLYANSGAMTPGITGETVDGMALEKIQHIIGDLRTERFKWTPVKRSYIPKKNGKLRPLGLPTWRDKLLQEVIRSILEAYYEPQFSVHSHGFRPQRGCHTALQEVATVWRGTRWFIEGDIAQCFDRLDHQVLVSILGEKLHDNRFLHLIRSLLEAGYLEDWRYHTTLSGSPQGGVVSPILANIYLDRLDKYIEQILLPAHNRGTRRRNNPTYAALFYSSHKLFNEGKHAEAKALCQAYKRLPSGDMQDPEYRRLRYIRYADDILLGFAGPKAEAKEIKRQLAEFLRDSLKLELSQEKTLITQASTEPARFLGYDIVVHQVNSKQDRTGRRCVNGGIGLRVPLDVIQAKCRQFMEKGRVTHRAELLEDDDFSIIQQYQSEYRGVVQYYLLAENVGWFQKLHWVMQGSLLKTLAAKHKTSLKQMKCQLGSTTITPHGPIRCLETQIQREGKKPLIARFGGIPLRQQSKAVLTDQKPLHVRIVRNELVKRLLADKCEICGYHGKCQVHHVRKLADLNMKGRRAKPLWMQIMAARRRKTLVVCSDCHRAIHAGLL